MSEKLQAVGRRKNAIAQVRLVPGTGQRTVNGHAFRAYFDRDSLVDHGPVEAP